ncbi:MAG: DUF3137 domain-containing protein [Cytophagaceae bacterium]|nr:DUF3137 domain-containing protein [Cytophagaceae bacterium]
MKSLEEFRSYCNGTLQSTLVDLEAKKKAFNKKLLLTFLFAGLIVLLGIFVHPFAFALFIGLGFYIYFGPVKAYQAFHKAFKENLIRAIISFIDPNLSYDSNRCIGQSTFEYSNIFQDYINRYSGDDCVWGSIGQTSIEFSEISARRVEGSGKERKEYDIFKGLFFIADFNKNFNGETYVLTDVAQSFLGSFGQKLQSMDFTRPALVKLEDPEFEKAFVVHSSDQVEARYILSTSFMERMLQLKKKMGTRVQCSFKSSKIFMAIPMRKSFLAPPVFGSMLDLKNIEEYFNDLKMIIEIVEDLNLNTRIWSKQAVV